MFKFRIVDGRLSELRTPSLQPIPYHKLSFFVFEGNLKREFVEINKIGRIKWYSEDPISCHLFQQLNLVNCILFIKHVLMCHIDCWGSLNDTLDYESWA